MRFDIFSNHRKMEGMKIAIIDDEADINYVMGFELKNLGHEVVPFSSAFEAMVYLQKETPDIIICDFQMPKMNGPSLLKWLQAEGKKIDFYILTGEASMDSDQLKAAGVKDILFKPQDIFRLRDLFPRTLCAAI